MHLMPRYHFHFASRGGEQVPDPEGLELDDLRAAHRHAVKVIRRTALFTSPRWNAREWSVQVVDLERRWSVLTVLFPIAEHNERRRGETGFHARLGSERHPVLSTLSFCGFAPALGLSEELLPFRGMRPEAAPCELWLAMTAKMIQTQEHRHSRRACQRRRGGQNECLPLPADQLQLPPPSMRNGRASQRC
jgi:hypothetical protein